VRRRPGVVAVPDPMTTRPLPCRPIHISCRTAAPTGELRAQSESPPCASDWVSAITEGGVAAASTPAALWHVEHFFAPKALAFLAIDVAVLAAPPRPFTTGVRPAVSPRSRRGLGSGSPVPDDAAGELLQSRIGQKRLERGVFTLDVDKPPGVVLPDHIAASPLRPIPKVLVAQARSDERQHRQVSSTQSSGQGCTAFRSPVESKH
jgi:hypothetical protein